MTNSEIFAAVDLQSNKAHIDKAFVMQRLELKEKETAKDVIRWLVDNAFTAYSYEWLVEQFEEENN